MFDCTAAVGRTLHAIGHAVELEAVPMSWKVRRSSALSIGQNPFECWLGIGYCWQFGIKVQWWGVRIMLGWVHVCWHRPSKERVPASTQQAQPAMAPCPHCNAKILSQWWIHCPMCGARIEPRQA